MAVLEQYGLPCRMVCTACGEWIRFLGNYNALPEVWECGLCAETCKEFEGTGLSILGTVMCGRCHEYRRALEIRAPLHPHPCHLGESVPLHMYKKVPADAARVHAVLNLRDLYEAWLLLHKAFSSAAWNPLDTQRRELFSGVAWETDEGHSLPTDQALNADIVLTESTAGYNTHMLYQKLGVECPGLQSVVISMLMILNAKKLGRLGGGNVGRSRGYLFFCEDSEIKVNKELQKMLDNPELLNMEFATKVAKKMTHDWDVSQRALVVRCDCEFQKGGSRKLSAPGMWDKRALIPDLETIVHAFDIIHVLLDRMKLAFNGLVMLIPGPRPHGKNAEVLLEPLIDELLELAKGHADVGHWVDVLYNPREEHWLRRSEYAQIWESEQECPSHFDASDDEMLAADEEMRKNPYGETGCSQYYTDSECDSDADH
eukprot:gene18964-22665_t